MSGLCQDSNLLAFCALAFATVVLGLLGLVIEPERKSLAWTVALALGSVGAEAAAVV